MEIVKIMCGNCMISPKEPIYPWNLMIHDWMNMRDIEVFDELSKPLNGEDHMARTFEEEDKPHVTKEILIARIQQFYDHMRQWHNNIVEERRIIEREEKQEMDWPNERLMIDLIDQFCSHFDDVLSDKYL